MISKIEAARHFKNLEALVKQYGLTHGVNVDMGNYTYGTEGNYKVKITKSTTSENGTNPVTKQSQAFLSHHCSLPAAALFKEFVHKGDTYKIIGYNTRASKMPIDYIFNGRPYKCPELYMENILKKAMPHEFV